MSGTMNRLAFLGAVGALCAPALGQGARPLTEGLHQQVLGLFRELEEGRVGSMGIVGDSVSLLDASYNWQLRNHFWAEYGSAGDGYLGIARFTGNCGNSGGGPRCGLELIRGPGSFTSDDTGWWDPLGQATPDGMWGQLVFDRVPGNWTLHAYGREIIVHYTRRVGSGPMNIRVNGVLLDTVQTGLNEGEPMAGRYVIDTGVDDPNVLTAVRFETASTLPVQINALEMRSSDPGFRYHRLARGGAGPRMFQDSMTQATADVLRSLDMDLMLVMLDAAAGDGQNDPALYGANLETLVDWYLQQLPETRLVLVTHHPFRPEIEAQADEILRIARERGLGYINLYDLFSGWEEMNDLGLMNGVVHLSLLGGQWFGAYIYDVLHQAGLEAVRADWNRDGVFDFFDVLAFLDAYAKGSADANADGQTDFFDLLAFLEAFDAAGA